MKLTKGRAFFILLILFIGVFTSNCLADDTVFKKLISANCLKCVFQDGYVAKWLNGNCKIERDKTLSPIIFDSINLKNQTARMIGNQGATEINVLPTINGITFIEQTGFGNIMVTTVFPYYKKYTDEFICVHSRHVNMPGGPLPSQYQGTCKIFDLNP